MEFIEVELIGEIIIGLMLVASMVAIAVRRLRMPYTVALVLVGLSASFIIQYLNVGEDLLGQFDLRSLLVPQLIMALLVPPLIFEAATHIKFKELGRNLRMILTFAIPGVILTMFVVAGFVFWGGAPLSWEMALVFGALIAATDPVAVVALFRTMGVPKRLLILLEGESLFNDGTAIVIYNMMVLIALGTTDFDLFNTLQDFVIVSGGGLLIGVGISRVISAIIRRVDDHLIEITLTMVIAYGSYLTAEAFHLSGVLAVVAAGLVTGNIGPRGMSPTTRIAMNSFWEYASFLANSMVFLTIGMVISIPEMLLHWRIILLAIVAVLIARAIVIYLFSNIRSGIPRNYQHIIYWGGMRGAISLAMALSLPQVVKEIIHNNPGLNSQGMEEMAILIQAMSFGVVLFSLLVQGTTMQGLIKKMNIIKRSPSQDDYEQNQARAVAARASYRHLEELNQEGLISEHTWEMFEGPLKRLISSKSDAVKKILHQDRTVEITEMTQVYEEALRSQRSTYSDLLSGGLITEENFSKLVAEVDYALLNPDHNHSDFLHHHSGEIPLVTHLITAVVDQNDITDTLKVLNIMGVPTTRMDSSNGAQRGEVTTLLMGVEENYLEEVVNAILGCCSSQPDFSHSLKGYLPRTKSKELSVSGITIFAIPIERYEEF